MVMSIGYNPFYKNTIRSAEVHILEKFSQDFYGAEMRVKVLGFIRPEFDYVDLESLVKDIRVDCEVGARSMEREGWRKQSEDGWFWEDLPEEEMPEGRDAVDGVTKKGES